MIKKVLIANRGEIAVRVIRACREMGIRSVAAYSNIDAESMAVLLADESFCIGPAAPAKSYLNQEALIRAALATGADAIHPGYGFLSENPAFAYACREAGIIFIGPDPEHMEMMGDKAQAREEMIKAGVPVVPGSDGVLEDYEAVCAAATQIGYPLMIKAVSGGGGRGIRVVEKAEELEQSWQTARAEARTAFKDDRVYMERRIIRPRHVEVQIMADRHGNVLTLGERDCSLQRRNQKVIEESPCSVLTEEQREALSEAGRRAASAVGYVGAGTLEFLMEADGSFYFMEMNTRIQVEHPVTEMVTGLDLIKEQIRVASGELLSMKQSDVHINGHAIECRINAENPAQNFRAEAGTIRTLHLPGGIGVRTDFYVYQDYKVPPTYDSMIGKVIVWGRDREEAILRMRRALDETFVDGINTNIEFHKLLLRMPEFVSGNFNIITLEDKLPQLIAMMQEA